MEMESIRNSRLVKMCLIFAGVWFFFRYLFNPAAPFIFAFLLITLCYPLLEHMQKRVPIKKKFLAVGIILPIILAMMGILWAVFILGCRQLEGLPGFCTQAGEQFQIFFHQCCCGLDGRFGWDSGRIERFVAERVTAAMDNIQIQVMPKLLASSYNCFKGLFSALGFLAVTCIAALLLEKEYVGIVDTLKKSKELRFVWAAVEGILSYIIPFLRTQGVLMLIISTLCVGGLSMAGIQGAVLFGILAGVLDVLPFIGTGVVLVPLAVWQLLNTQYTQMTVCLVLYAVCIVTRELLEPKLIGKRVGIAPVFMLLAIYGGVKLFGIGGIIKGPLALIAIVEIFKVTEKGPQFDEKDPLHYNDKIDFGKTR